MNQSKADKLAEAIRRHVEDAIAEEVVELARSDEAAAAMLIARKRHVISVRVGVRVAQTYATLELIDIAKWEQGKRKARAR